MLRVGRWVGVVVCLASIGGCVVDPGAAPDQAVARSVVVEDDELVLREGDERRILTRFGDADGTPVHAALRPGDPHEPTVVVVLSRVPGQAGDPVDERYELRYLVATEDEVGELRGFPAEQQVAAESPAILDVAPVPVWSPAGDAIAWIEWVEQGTRLRTVGWTDDAGAPNPSDDAAAYALADVPPGVQLEDWQTSDEGDPVLLGWQDDQPYRIQLALGDSPTGVTADR